MIQLTVDVQVMADKLPDLLDFYKDLPDLEAATKVSFHTL